MIEFIRVQTVIDLLYTVYISDAKIPYERLEFQKLSFSKKELTFF